MENAVIYARYSSHSQTEQSIEGQLSAAKSYAAAKGYCVVNEYIDRAISGRTDNREHFQKMLSDCAKKTFTVIIVWKVDRFGRNREEITFNKYRAKKHGVRVEYVAENLPDTPEGVILESVLEGMAEYYSLQLSQNIRRGNAESAAKCQCVGGPRPLGYTVDPKTKKYIVDESTAPTVRYIFNEYAAGKTCAEICEDLNKKGLRTSKGAAFNKNSLRKMLQNEIYIGVYHYDTIRVPGGVPAIIEPNLFSVVGERIEQNNKTGAQHMKTADYILSGKLFCGECGSKMLGESGKSKTGKVHGYYLCNGHKKAKSCQMRAIRQSTIEEAVLAYTKELIRDDSVMDAIEDAVWDYYQKNNQEEDLTASLKEQLRDVDFKLKNLTKAVEEGMPISVVADRIAELKADHDDLTASIARVAASAPPPLTREYVRMFLRAFRDTDLTDRAAQKEMIHVFIRAIYVFPDSLTVCYNYGDKRESISLSDVKNGTESFGNRVECSTIAHLYELSVFCRIFALKVKRPRS